MISEKIYYILLAIILFIVFSQLKVMEGFFACRNVKVRRYASQYVLLRQHDSQTGRTLQKGYYKIPPSGTLVVDGIRNLNDKVTLLYFPRGYVLRFYRDYYGRGPSRLYVGGKTITLPTNNKYSSFVVGKFPELSSTRVASGAYSKPRGKHLRILDSRNRNTYYPIRSTGRLDIGGVGNKIMRKFILPTGYVIKFYQYYKRDYNFRSGKSHIYDGLDSKWQTIPRGMSSFCIRPLIYKRGRYVDSGSRSRPYEYISRRVCTRTPPKPTTRKPATSYRRPVNCSATTKSAKTYKSAYETQVAKKRELKSAYDKMKQDQRSCQTSINNSLKNLNPDQKAALIAAEKQLTATQNVLKDARGAYRKTRRALGHQKEAGKIMLRDNSESIKTLQGANEEIEKSNQQFAKKQENEFKLVNISPLDAEFFGNTSLSGNESQKWQQEWGKDLN